MVGKLNDRPVVISLNSAMIDGQKILFIDATSELVDWGIVEAWLEKNLPSSARDGYRINRTDALNFHNVFRRAQAGAAA